MNFSKKWRQGVLTAADQFTLLAWAIAVAFSRGFDYLSGYSADSYDVIARAFHHQSVGFMLIAGAGALVIGVVTKTHLLVYLGHGWLALVYLVLSIGIIIGSHNDTMVIRSISVILFSFVLHLVWALRTGARPLENGVNQATAETVVEPEGAEG